MLFGMMPNAEQQSTGFGQNFAWDIPLTDGYQWQQLDNKSDAPNLSGFSGIDCPTVYQVIKDHNPDAIILTGWHSKLLLQTLWAALRLNIKTIVRGDSNAIRPRRWYVRLLHAVFLRRFDAFLTVGKSNRLFFLNNGINTNLLFSAPYFIENQRFIDGALISRTDSKKTTLTEAHFCFLFAGKLVNTKNIQELLTAFKMTHEHNNKCQLMIVGDGDLRPELEAFTQQHGLPVIFTGFVNQSVLPSTYSQGDCFVLSSDNEAWGLVVNEAMVCGLPAIVSNRVGACDDLIIEGQTGFMYPCGSPEALAQKMIYMVENRGIAKKMGQKAQQHILDNFGVKHTVQATLDALTFLRQH